MRDSWPSIWRKLFVPFSSSFFYSAQAPARQKEKRGTASSAALLPLFISAFFCAGLLPVAGVLRIRLGCPCMRRAGALYRPTGRRLLSGLQFIVTALILFEEELILSALLRNHFAFKHTSSVWPELPFLFSGSYLIVPVSGSCLRGSRQRIPSSKN